MKRTTILLALVACAPKVEPNTADRDPVVVIEPSTDEPQVVEETSDDQTPTPRTDPIQAGDSGAPCDSRLALALQIAIRSREASEVSTGMKPVGPIACVVLAEGATHTEALTLGPSRCYTILAHSFPEVTEIDIEMVPDAVLAGTLPPTLAGVVLAKDSETGPIATIGKGTTCFKNPLPLPAPVSIRVTARKGWGPVALQAFSK